MVRSVCRVSSEERERDSCRILAAGARGALHRVQPAVATTDSPQVQVARSQGGSRSAGVGRDGREIERLRFFARYAFFLTLTEIFKFAAHHITGTGLA